MCRRSTVALKGGGGGAMPSRAIGAGQGVEVEGRGVPLTMAMAWWIASWLIEAGGVLELCPCGLMLFACRPWHCWGFVGCIRGGHRACSPSV
jgi:hypothetical protein